MKLAKEQPEEGNVGMMKMRSWEEEVIETNEVIEVRNSQNRIMKMKKIRSWLL